MKKDILILLAALAVVSCSAPSIMTGGRVNYVEDGFTLDAVRENSIAILPVVAGAGDETFRRPMNESIESVMDSVLPDVKYISWQATLAAINDADLLDEYRDAISTFRETAIVPKGFLQSLSATVGTRYALFLGSGDYTVTGTPALSNIGGLYTDRKGTLNVIGQLWDAESGSVVWEGVGEAESWNESAIGKLPEQAKYIRAAALSLVNQLRFMRQVNGETPQEN